MVTATAAEGAVTLESLRGGVVPELFQEHLEKALANLMDERTDPKKPRSVVVQVDLRARVEKLDDGEEDIDRDVPTVNVKVSSKLAPIETGEGTYRVRLDRERDVFQLALTL